MFKNRLLGTVKSYQNQNPQLSYPQSGVFLFDFEITPD